MPSSPIKRRHVLASAALAALAPRAPRAAPAPVRIGLLVDANGPYSEVSGPGSIAAARFAVQDFVAQHPDIPVELLVGDMRINADLALSLARNWFDNEGVAMILGVPFSAAALALAGLVRDKNRVAMFTEPGSSELTAGACGPNHLHWTYDTFSATVPAVEQLVGEGRKDWFVLAPDYAIGTAVLADTQAAVTARGGRVVGSVRYAFPGTSDFSSFLLQAQASGAQVLCLANAGTDLQNTIKQFDEFGLGRQMVISAPLLEIPEMRAIGQAACQGLTGSTSYYWNRDDASRAFARRMSPLLHDEPPVQNHLGAYCATTHFLKTITDPAVRANVLDGRATMRALKAMPVDDPVLGQGRVRADGRVIHDVLVLEGKTPAEATGPFDIMKVVRVVPGEQAFRPMLERCQAAAG